MHRLSSGRRLLHPWPWRGSSHTWADKPEIWSNNKEGRQWEEKLEVKTPGISWEQAVAMVWSYWWLLSWKRTFHSSKRGRGQDFWCPGLVTVNGKCKLGTLVGQGSSSHHARCTTEHLRLGSAPVFLACVPLKVSWCSLLVVSGLREKGFENKEATQEVDFGLTEECLNVWSSVRLGEAAWPGSNIREGGGKSRHSGCFVLGVFKTANPLRTFPGKAQRYARDVGEAAHGIYLLLDFQIKRPFLDSCFPQN